MPTRSAPAHRPHNSAADMKVRLLQALLSFSLLSFSLSETQHRLNTVEDALAEGKDSSSNAGAAAGRNKQRSHIRYIDDIQPCESPAHERVDGEDL